MICKLCSTSVMGAASLLALGAATAARAQDAADNSAQPAAASSAQPVSQSDDGDALKEIVVTAQFRSENLQRTPLAITALSGAALEARSITNITDVGRTAPSVTLRLGSSGYGKSTQAYIRGIGQTDYNFALEPAVGFYVDDVYHASLFGSTFDLLDLERVEILRGPQGTLFGKNSIGGAVRIVSKKPSNNLEGSLEGTYGSYNRIDVRGMLNLPIIDDVLALRVSAATKNRDGYVDRIDFACANPAQAGNLKPVMTNGKCKVGTLGGESVRAGRAALRFTPSPALEVNLTAEIIRDNSEGAADSLVTIKTATAGIVNYNNNVLVPTYGIPYDQRFLPPNPYVTYASYDNKTLGVQVPAVNTLHSQSYSGDIEWKLADSLKIKSITAWQRFSGRFTQDAANTPLPITLTDNQVYLSQFTQEIRLLGNIGSLLDWTAGGFYFKSHSGIGGFVAISASGIAFDQNDTQVSENKSAYLHGVMHLGRVNVTAGVRYSDESKSYTFDRTNEPAKTPFFPGGAFTSPASAYSRWDYKLGVDYQVTDQIMAYGQYSTGYKGGGINPRPFTPAAAVPFGPEKLGAYELGLKTQLFDRRLRFNLATYHSIYTNLQLSANGFDNNGTPSIVIANVGRAHIDGIEAELQFQPVRNLLIDGSASYTHFKIKDLGTAAGVSGGPTLSSKAPATPTWKYNAGIQYTFDLGDFGSLSPRFDIYYQSKIYAEYTNDPVAAQDGYAVSNAKLTYTAPTGGWSGSVGVTNLFNKFYYVNKFIQAGSYIYTGQPSRPREWYLTIRKSF